MIDERLAKFNIFDPNIIISALIPSAPLSIKTSITNPYNFIPKPPITISQPKVLYDSLGFYNKPKLQPKIEENKEDTKEMPNKLEATPLFEFNFEEMEKTDSSCTSPTQQIHQKEEMYIINFDLAKNSVIPQENVIPVQKDQEPNNNHECCICFENNELKILACKHLICQQCLDRWLPTKKICPFCRQKITKKSIKKYYGQEIKYPKRRKTIRKPKANRIRMLRNILMNEWEEISQD